jgi:RNA polymerase sigma-70 factor, ECF subfamily
MQVAKMSIQKLKQPVEIGLVQLARQGDVAAFNRLALDYQDTAFNLAYYILGSTTAAESAIQAAINKAFHGLKVYPGDSFCAWLLRCVLVICRECERSQSRQHASTWFHPGKLEDCLNCLSFEQRVIVLLIDMECLSYAETAWIMGMPIEAVRTGLAAARLKLGRSAPGI